MRFIFLVKATEESEAGATPEPEVHRQGERVRRTAVQGRRRRERARCCDRARRVSGSPTRTATSAWSRAVRRVEGARRGVLADRGRLEAGGRGLGEARAVQERSARGPPGLHRRRLLLTSRDTTRQGTGSGSLPCAFTCGFAHRLHSHRPLCGRATRVADEGIRSGVIGEATCPTCPTTTAAPRCASSYSARSARWSGDRALELGSAHRRTVLAVLASSPGSVVSREELVDAVWGDAPPASANGSIYTYISSLRHALGGKDGARSGRDVLESVGSGYSLRVPDHCVDVHRFEALRLDAERTLRGGAPAAALRTLDEALGLWHGEALAGLSAPFAEVARTRLGELRLATTELRAEACLAAGRHAEVIADLSALTREYPLREMPRELLIRALRRVRPADRGARGLRRLPRHRDPGVGHRAQPGAVRAAGPGRSARGHPSPARRALRRRTGGPRGPPRSPAAPTSCAGCARPRRPVAAAPCWCRARRASARRRCWPRPSRSTRPPSGGRLPDRVRRRRRDRPAGPAAPDLDLPDHRGRRAPDRPARRRRRARGRGRGPRAVRGRPAGVRRRRPALGRRGQLAGVAPPDPRHRGAAARARRRVPAAARPRRAGERAGRPRAARRPRGLPRTAARRGRARDGRAHRRCPARARAAPLRRRRGGKPVLRQGDGREAGRRGPRGGRRHRGLRGRPRRAARRGRRPDHRPPRVPVRGHPRGVALGGAAG